MPFLTLPPMQPCMQCTVPCPQRRNRTPQQLIRMYFSPLRAAVGCGPLFTLWRLWIPSWSSSQIRVLQYAHIRDRTGGGRALISLQLADSMAHSRRCICSRTQHNCRSALEANIIGECCLHPRTGPHQETKLLTQRNDLLKTLLQLQIFLAAEESFFEENLSAVLRGDNTPGHRTLTSINSLQSWAADLWSSSSAVLVLSASVRVHALHPVATRDNDALEKCLGETLLQVCWTNSSYLWCTLRQSVARSSSWTEEMSTPWAKLSVSPLPHYPQNPGPGMRARFHE